MYVSQLLLPYQSTTVIRVHCIPDATEQATQERPDWCVPRKKIAAARK